MEADDEQGAEAEAPAEAKPEAAAEVAEQTDDLDQKFAAYRDLRLQLLPVEQSVQSNAMVQTSRQQYFEALIAEMERIDPKAPELLAKHRELTSVVRQLATQAQRG